MTNKNFNSFQDSRKQTTDKEITHRQTEAFSLIEAVLAIGIFFVTVLVLIGMLGPLLNSVNDVKTTDEVVSVVDSLNSFLQSDAPLAMEGSNFDLFYQAIQTRGYATVYVFRSYVSKNSSDIKLSMGFSPKETTTTLRIDRKAKVQDFKSAAGSIYRAVITLSPFISREYYRDRGRSAFPRYTLSQNSQNFENTFLSLNVDLFAEEPGPSFRDEISLKALYASKPTFSFSTGINR